MSRALLVLLAANTAAAQTAREIVARADSVRNPTHAFHFTNTVVDYVSGHARDQLALTVYSKPDSSGTRFDNLVRYAEPARDVGKMVLFNGANMWFYDPTPKTSVRISPQQRLIGLASNGDVVTVALAHDYTSTLAGEDTLRDADRQRRTCWHVNLVAADNDAIYSRIEMWIEKGTYRPIKGKYYSDSGRPLKIAYFHRYEPELGAVRPDEVIIIDAIDPNLVTTMTLSDYGLQDIPAAWFQRDFLPRLSAVDTASAEDRDLAAIPTLHHDSTASRPVRASKGRLYAEDAATASDLRDGFAVPPPGPRPVDWENRTSLDVTDRLTLPAQLTAHVSGRLNLIEQNGVHFGYDWRESYLTWEPKSRFYLEAGRINVRNGVALGFNPTDYFRSRTLVAQVSQDPSALREDRLGTLLVRAERLWTGASLSVAFAPKLYAPSAIATQTPTSTTPELDRTNAADRLLVSASADIAGLAPQTFLYHEGSRTRFGADLSRLVSQSIVAYAEWSGGVAPSLAEEAVRYGKATRSLPASAPAPALGDSGSRFRNDLAAGGSWSNGQAELTINAEYHYSDLGLTHSAWRRWFALGSHSPAQLWYIRGYANDQQQPITRQQMFVRVDRQDAIVRDLELTAFAFVDLYDGSSLIQLAATYLASNWWTFAAYVPFNLGATHSERGSLTQVTGLTLQLVRYL